jgi:phosphohistidine phosphatase
MGNLLKEENVNPDLLISSPAKRAITTAEIIAKNVGYPSEDIGIDERIYEADVESLLKIINEVPENISSLMLVGHNPGITSLSNCISDKRIDNIPTSGFVYIELTVKHWKDVDFDKGKILTFDYPKKYTGMQNLK